MGARNVYVELLPWTFPSVIKTTETRHSQSLCFSFAQGALVLLAPHYFIDRRMSKKYGCSLVRQPTPLQQESSQCDHLFKPPCSCLASFHGDSSAATLVRASGKPASKPYTGPWKTSLLQTLVLSPQELQLITSWGGQQGGGEDPGLGCFLKKEPDPAVPHREWTSRDFSLDWPAEVPHTSWAAVETFRERHTYTVLTWNCLFLLLRVLLFFFPSAMNGNSLGIVKKDKKKQKVFLW